MPLTWFAHQVPVVGMKLAHRHWFDSVALCVGSMMPDLMYSFSAYVDIDPHGWPAAFTYGIPLALVLAVIGRHIVAASIPVVLPDLGSFRLRSFGVLALRRPPILVTLTSVVLGIGSHVVIDWFTHVGGRGTRWLGYDDVVVTAFGVTTPLADVLQMLGHTLGSVAGVWLLWFIGRSQLLDQWYGTAQVAVVREQSVDHTVVVSFWSITLVGLAAGVAWGVPGELIEQIQRPAIGLIVGLIVASAWVNRFTTRPVTFTTT